MIEFTNVTKTYKSKKAGDTVALNNISFKIPSKGLTFLTGESGCGKSTLLNVLGGLDNIDSGVIKVEDKVLKLNLLSSFLWQITKIIKLIVIIIVINITINLFLLDLDFILPS